MYSRPGVCVLSNCPLWKSTMYIFYQLLGTAVLDSSLCLLLFHLLYPILPYFPKEIFLGPSSFTPLAQTCLSFAPKCPPLRHA